MTDIALILTAILLVLMNAFFVAAEFGMVKLRSTRIKTIQETHGIKGKILASVHRHLDAYLSACQLGITLASLGLGWVGESTFAHFLAPVLRWVGIISPDAIELIVFAVAFSIISFLHIVLGELMPKSLAIRQSEKVSLWTAVPLYCFYWFMYPAIWLLNTCSNYFLKLAGLDVIHHGEQFHSTEEIKLILSASHSHGELTQDETEIIEHTLEFADLKVTEVMRPQEEMVVLDIDQPIQQLMQTVLTTRFSRYPVRDKKQHKIIGIIHVKDLFSALYQKQKLTSLQTLVRPVLKVSRHLPALELLRKFREGMPHFALVYSGSENLIGFITLDNLLHVLIGRIKDEFHKTQDDWVANPDGSFTVKGKCSIYALEQALDRDLNVPDNGQIETVADLILQRFGAVPPRDTRLEFLEFDAWIQNVEKNQIQQLIIYPKKPPEENTLL